MRFILLMKEKNVDCKEKFGYRNKLKKIENYVILNAWLLKRIRLNISRKLLCVRH